MPKQAVVVGPPGTGKTEFLARLTEDWFKHGVDSREISYLAFTKAAASEAADRIMGGDKSGGWEDDLGHRFPYFRTIHSLAYRGLIRDFPDMRLMTTADMKRFSQWSSFDGTFAFERWEDIAAVYQRIQGGGKTAWDQYLLAYTMSRISATTAADLEKYKQQPSDKTLRTLGMIELSPYKEFVEKYEAYKNDNGLVDFTDMLAHGLTKMQPISGVRHVVIDEAQDLSPICVALCDRIFEGAETCFWAGDEDQCIPGDEKILTTTGYRPIRDVQVGDHVISGEDQGSVGSYKVANKSVRSYTGDILKVTTETGKVFSCTPEHKVFCLWDMEGKWIVYIMRQGDFFRLGITKLGNKRMNFERNIDGMMPVAVFDNEVDARVCEIEFSLEFGIPTCLFPDTTARVDVLPPEARRRIFENSSSMGSAMALLASLKKSWQPIYKKGVHRGKSSRKMVNLYPLNFSRKRHGDPMLVQETGGARKDQRKLRKSFGDLKDAYQWLEKNPMDGWIFERWSFIPNRHCYRLQAKNLLAGVSLVPCVADGKVKLERVVSVEAVPYSGSVYDIEVEKAHNFITGDVLVSNCIYNFSGADSGLFINRFRHADIRVLLQQTRRFGQEVWNLADKVINRVSQRIPKTVYGVEGKEHEISISGEFEPFVSEALILHRLSAGCQGLASLYRANGLPFRNERGDDPLGVHKRVDNFRTMDALAKGEQVTGDQATEFILEFVPSYLTLPEGRRWLVPRGAMKKLSAEAIPGRVTLRDLQVGNFLTPDGVEAVGNKYFRVFDHSEDFEYYQRVLDNGYKLTGPNMPTITTIHGSKGRQSKKVVLFSEMSKKCWEDPDSEHRLAFVGMTRTEGILQVCGEQSVEWASERYDYPIVNKRAMKVNG